MVIDEVDAGARLAPSLPAVVRFSRGDLDPVIVEQFAAHVGHVARQLAERPDRPLESVNPMTSQEIRSILDLGANPAPGSAAGGVRRFRVRTSRPRTTLPESTMKTG
ncbi:hypothetical protein OG948_00805 [Embleya sp. NBC_00888]|uniref:hypothetical protein n=1 Tax=Embleya sp. NBC_00888 TaxID=2975960 RepID=UPI0038655BD4|nr:hypothetical protein OG948_00805 [Embleya sp. NBC_00888]